MNIWIVKQGDTKEYIAAYANYKDAERFVKKKGYSLYSMYGILELWTKSGAPNIILDKDEVR